MAAPSARASARRSNDKTVVKSLLLRTRSVHELTIHETMTKACYLAAAVDPARGKT